MSDSTTFRSMGAIFGYLFVSLNKMNVIINRLEPNKEIIIQEFSRTGRNFTLKYIHENFIGKLNLKQKDKEYLYNLIPKSYTGSFSQIIL
jgi:hypothetical protein